MLDYPALWAVRPGEVTVELWTIDQVAEFLGIQPNSADTELRRKGVSAVARQPGRGGKNLYDAEAVRALRSSSDSEYDT